MSILSTIEKEVKDTYREHTQHIRGEGGKKVPFFRNMKTCSTCYSELQRIIERTKREDRGINQSRGWNYESKEYEIKL